jgi:hypothetical protein
MSSEQAAAKLREVGEDEAAAIMEQVQSTNQETFGLLDWFRGRDRAWQHAAHAFGYLAPTELSGDILPIRHVGDIYADGTLKNTQIKITLDGLRVADYPGNGDHRILFDFYAQNQLPSAVEHVHFNSTYRIREGERAAILGYPIFIGLNVGTEGVAFRCFTVNVKNEQDEIMLNMMESDVFKAGLKLANTVQPAIAPLTGLAIALTKSIATRYRNVPVQDFYLGLDFTNITTGARLAIGSYIAVQIPESFKRVWDWKDWVYHPTSGQVVSKTDPERLIPYNYIILGVSSYGE